MDLSVLIPGLIKGFANFTWGNALMICVGAILIALAVIKEYEPVLLLPIGLAATIEYYRHGHVDIRAAFFLAVAMLLGSWVGALLANRMTGPHLRLAFGIFVLALGVYLIYGACKRLGWL